jgi:flagellar motor switch protein FliN
MTEAPAPARQPESEFLQIWSDSASQVLGQITGSLHPCPSEEQAPADLVPAAEADLWVMITISGSLRGELSLRLPAATVLGLAQIFTSEPATPEAELTSEHREAVVELLRQISGLVSTTAKPRWGEVQLMVESAPAAPSWSSAGTFWLRPGGQDAAGMILEFSLSAALAAALKADKVEPPKAAAPSAATDFSAPAPRPAVDSAQSAGAMDLLMDVRLAMTMRFGARNMLLREVLDLTPGTVVALDRKIQEPVDLLLDGKLVARGEVVVIDGNYGLRVTDVSPLGPG